MKKAGKRRLAVLLLFNRVATISRMNTKITVEISRNAQHVI